MSKQILFLQGSACRDVLQIEIVECRARVNFPVRTCVVSAISLSVRTCLEQFNFSAVPARVHAHHGVGENAAEQPKRKGNRKAAEKCTKHRQQKVAKK